MSWDPKKRMVFTSDYWDGRLGWALTKGCLHHAVFNTDIDTWTAIEKKHKEEIAKYIRPSDNILDVGCAYGRLIDLMPDGWSGKYLGIDVSLDFIEFARKTYPGRAFAVCDLRDLPRYLSSGKLFDWGVVVSVKAVITGHAGEEVWSKIEVELLKLCSKLLILDYEATTGAEIVG